MRSVVGNLRMCRQIHVIEYQINIPSAAERIIHSPSKANASQPLASAPPMPPASHRAIADKETIPVSHQFPFVQPSKRSPSAMGIAGRVSQLLTSRLRQSCQAQGMSQRKMRGNSQIDEFGYIGKAVWIILPEPLILSESLTVFSRIHNLKDRWFFDSKSSLGINTAAGIVISTLQTSC